MTETVTPPTALVTESSLLDDLRALGIAEGQTLIVHCSLSSLGWVAGGEQAVVAALSAAVGAEGTLVMPSQSWQLCDPAYLNDSRVPREWWAEIRAQLPAYDPRVTPTRTMGAVAEHFRALPGALRSAHPQRSFAARGPEAHRILAVHDLDSPVGERSPLSALYEGDASVLLLGVGYSKNTSFHLAEDRTDFPGKHTVRNGGPILRDGVRVWEEWEELWVVDDDFELIGADFAAETGLEARGFVGAATARLFPQRALVDFAQAWIAQKRTDAALSADHTGW